MFSLFFLISQGTSGLINMCRSWEEEIAERLWQAIWEAGWPLPQKGTYLTTLPLLAEGDLPLCLLLLRPNSNGPPAGA